MYGMSNVQYQSVYDTLLFFLASMTATTMHLWFCAFCVYDMYQSAVLTSCLVNFIVAHCHVSSTTGLTHTMTQILTPSPQI